MLGHFLTQFIHRVGPLGVALGAALEGETAVAIGGAAAHHGLFSPIASGAAAWAGSFLADQLVFRVSRRERDQPAIRRRLDSRAVSRGLHFLERHPVLFCCGFRFVYGFRIAGPAAVGISSVPARLFVGLNALSAAVWAATFTYLGDRFGMGLLHAVEPLLRLPHIFLELAVLAIALAMAAIWARRG